MAEGSSRKRARWGEGRVAYAALAPEIAEALEEGLPMTKVYALFEARLGMSYRQFIRYASPRAKERDHDPSPRPVQKPTRTEGCPGPSSPRQLPGAGDARGFHFDPSDIDSKKLI
ncbi:MAG TPA: TraK family protein [Geobacterales bacterium]|nr:TraK family protein [Geobacterales bacterium]